MTIYPTPSNDSVEKCDWTTFISADTDPPMETDDMDTIRLYFEQFCAPTIKAKNGSEKELVVTCPQCKKVLNDMFEALVHGGGFTWGLLHGAGHCRECGWPCAGHHYIRSPDGEDLVSLLEFPLPYHPEYVTRIKPEDQTK